MGLTHLQQILRILCCNTEWNFAVFWKLQYGGRMILTLEDAFYDNHNQYDPSKTMYFNQTHENDENDDGRYLGDPLGLAVAKMSCRAYSLGEGLIGQVALTGKHQWISSYNPIPRFLSSKETSDGWETLFSAGIRTTLAVSVVPNGVVQLGSLNNVIEDMNFITLMKNVLFSPQSFAGLRPSPGQNLARSNLYQGKGVEVVGDVGDDVSISRNNVSAELPQPTSGLNGVGDETLARMELLRDENLWGVKNGSKNNQLQEEVGPKSVLENKSSHVGTLNTIFNFSTGCELHEALGSAFKKEQDSVWNESERAETGVLSLENAEAIVSSWITTVPESEDLLEAVVGSVCPSSTTIKVENSSCKSAQSLLTTEKTQQIPHHIKQSNDSVSESVVRSFSLEEESERHINSVWEPSKLCAKKAPVHLPSKIGSAFEQLEKRVEPAVMKRKRGRHGETCRPRPRDRQLIQDRVRELRELVPNGSKCSIDALLARTIKHMLFLESVTKHADKLKKCAESKLHDKEMGAQAFYSEEYGSSWALEVGSQTKVCPIIVENLNKDGQMLVEMLCEECGHFLELADAIRGLGLTILRAVIEARDEMAWACFVVEGNNGCNVHRMDILLSLMQLLKPKTSNNGVDRPFASGN